MGCTVRWSYNGLRTINGSIGACGEVIHPKRRRWIPGGRFDGWRQNQWNRRRGSQTPLLMLTPGGRRGLWVMMQGVDGGGGQRRRWRRQRRRWRW